MKSITRYITDGTSPCRSWVRYPHVAHVLIGMGVLELPQHQTELWRKSIGYLHTYLQSDRIYGHKRVPRSLSIMNDKNRLSVFF